MLIDQAEEAIPLLTATWHVADGQRSLCVSGELDIDTAPRLAAALEGEIRPGTCLTLCLADLEFIDASGIRVLGSVGRTVGSSGRVLLRQPGPMVQRILAIAGLDGANGFDQSMKGISV